MRTKRLIGAIAALALSTSVSAIPTLTLTPEGVAKGFSLTTFVDDYFFGNYGPLAQGVLPNGNVITGSLGSGSQILIFKDTDNQTLADALSATPYINTTGNPHYAMATAGGQVYGAQLFGGAFEKFANDGSHTAITGDISRVTNFLGMWGNPVNGHLLAMGSNQGLIDINPLDGSFRVVNGGVFGDGLTVSPDGKIVFVEVNGGIESYDLATGTFIRRFNTGHGPDGTGVITGGLLNGQIVVNNNDGTLLLIDPAKGDLDPDLFTLLATGGSRGDFVSPDLNNGTLFISQIESVLRLSCGPDCSIGGPPPALPEPITGSLLGLGLLGLGYSQRRKRVQA